ncbi:hypothetical protein BS78_06G004000 [Paspalum vaginatum]|nr:hypothetical protein BS78_06G004000 [Paspalum vaginatum]
MAVPQAYLQHLINHHGFVSANTTYDGYKDDIPLVRGGSGLVLTGQEEHFVFFIAESGLLCLYWLGDAQAKADRPSFRLKVLIYQPGRDAPRGERVGCYLVPLPASRVKDPVLLCPIFTKNIGQQHFYLRVLIEDIDEPEG